MSKTKHLVQVQRNGRRLTRRVHGSKRYADVIRQRMEAALDQPGRRALSQAARLPSPRELVDVERLVERALMLRHPTDVSEALAALRSLTAEIRRLQRFLKWTLDFVPGWCRKYAPWNTRYAK